MTRVFYLAMFGTMVACSSGGSAGGASDAMPDASPPPPVEPAGLKRTSQHGDYVLWLAGADASLQKGVPTTLDLTVRTSAGAPAPGLTFDVSFVHTMMGHGSGKIPEVADAGGGAYAVSNVLASMTGAWAFTLTFATDDGDDTASFDIEVK